MNSMTTGAIKTKAAGAGTQAALENTQLDYAPLHELVQANIDGQRAAKEALAKIGGSFADPDALYLAIKAVSPETRDIRALTRMRGLMRILQTAIERGAV